MTGIIDVLAALQTAIEGDTTIAGLLAGEKTYVNGPRIGENAPLDYITLHSPDEGSFPLFARSAYKGSVTVSVWSRTASGGLVIYKNLMRVLDKIQLTLAENIMMKGRLSLTYSIPDAGDSHIIHTRCGYEYDCMSRSS